VVTTTTTTSVDKSSAHTPETTAPGLAPLPSTSKLHFTPPSTSNNGTTATAAAAATATTTSSDGGAGAYPSEQKQPRPHLSPVRPESTSGITTRTTTTTQSITSPPPTSTRSKEEVSFQFDRQVQEIRRRRTVAKRAPRPDRDDFTRIESESGKRILDYRLYAQAVCVCVFIGRQGNNSLRIYLCFLPKNTSSFGIDRVDKCKSIMKNNKPSADKRRQK
jgi:hypothetical protein